METKFTKGPWHRSQILDDGRWGIITDDNLIIIGTSQHLTKENADLISASPELYDACYWANWLLETREIKQLLEKHYPQWGDPDEVHRKLKSAIKKAMPI